MPGQPSAEPSGSAHFTSFTLVPKLNRARSGRHLQGHHPTEAAWITPGDASVPGEMHHWGDESPCTNTSLELPRQKIQKSSELNRYLTAYLNIPAPGGKEDPSQCVLQGMCSIPAITGLSPSILFPNTRSLALKALAFLQEPERDGATAAGSSQVP